MYDEGKEIPGSGKGYRHDHPQWRLCGSGLTFCKYFGRARELPDVKKLFEAAMKPREDKP